MHRTEDTLACKSEIQGKLEMWCWRRMEKISWTDRVRNEEVLHRVKEEMNNLHIMKGRKANWIGHSWRRNVLLKHVIEEKIDGRIRVTVRRGRRRKEVENDLKEMRGYWNTERGSTRSHSGENSLRENDTDLS